MKTRHQRRCTAENTSGKRGHNGDCRFRISILIVFLIFLQYTTVQLALFKYSDFVLCGTDIGRYIYDIVVKRNYISIGTQTDCKNTKTMMAVKRNDISLQTDCKNAKNSITIPDQQSTKICE